MKNYEHKWRGLHVLIYGEARVLHFVWVQIMVWWYSATVVLY